MRFKSLLGLPALSWFIFFVLAPLGIVLVASFASRGTYGSIIWDMSPDNYLRAFSWVHAEILWRSICLALFTTASCAFIAVPIVWAMATSEPRHRHIYVCAVALPFLTNLIIRIYAIRFFVGYNGPLQFILRALGLSFDPFALSQNSLLVFYGMVTTYLPFMVMPLYGAFEKMDFSLVEAAQDLGAGQVRILFSVILPNLKKALIGGAVLVFVPSLGEYIIPDLLGGAKSMLYGNLITQEFLKSRDWPLGSALSVLLVFLLLLFAFILSMAGRTTK